MAFWLCVLLRVITNPLSNVFQKLLTSRGAAAPLVILAVHAGLTIVMALAVPWLPRPAPSFWPAIIVSAILAVAGNALIVAALRTGDLSVLGPINAYKPIVGLVPAALLLGEFPSSLGLLGIGLVLIGSYGLVDRTAGVRLGLASLWSDRGVRLRVAALIVSATEAVFLKRALQAATPTATFVYWSILGLPAALVMCLLPPHRDPRPSAAAFRSAKFQLAGLVVTTGLMQWSTLVVLADLQVSYSLALFQTSSILAVAFGALWFGEPHFWKRLLGSIVMVCGAVLIMLSR